MSTTTINQPEWVTFCHNKKELCAISIDGVFPGEIRETAELIADENNLKLEDIKIGAR